MLLLEQRRREQEIYEFVYVQESKTSNVLRTIIVLHHGAVIPAYTMLVEPLLVWRGRVGSGCGGNCVGACTMRAMGCYEYEYERAGTTSGLERGMSTRMVNALVRVRVLVAIFPSLFLCTFPIYLM